MSKSNKNKKRKHVPRRTYENPKYNKNAIENEQIKEDKKEKKPFSFWELLRKIAIWIILLATLVGMSSWIFAIFH